MFLPRPMRSQCTQPRHIVKTQRQRPKKVISENSPIASPSTSIIAHQSIDSHTPRLSDTQNIKSRRKPLILSRPSKLYDPEPLYSVRFLPLQPARASTPAIVPRHTIWETTTITTTACFNRYSVYFLPYNGTSILSEDAQGCKSDRTLWSLEEIEETRARRDVALTTHTHTYITQNVAIAIITRQSALLCRQ